MTQNAADITLQIRSITGYVRDCAARAAKGEVMDLQGLDQNVIDICNAITSLPEADGKKLERDMATLIAALDDLAATMKQSYGGLLAAAGER